MKSFLIIFAVAVVVVLFIGVSWVIGSYNNLVTLNETVDTKWSDVETNYQRRYDLIPNLVNATKGYLQQEQKVFGDIAEARTRYARAPAGSQEKVEAMSGLEGAIGRLLVIIENYPQLKSNETVRGLMDELAGTENRISVARQRYNETVKQYNITIRRFPSSIIAGIFNFEKKPLYEAEEGADKAPTVDLTTQ